MYLFNLKRKVKNKAYVEASIYKPYIIKEIPTFILYYFKPQLRTRINRVLRDDDGKNVSLSEKLSIFPHFGQFVPKSTVRGRYLSE